jgi:hypothetical protein
MVHNPNWSNPDKNGESDWCKKGKEYIYVTKQDWIKCSVCEK